MSINLRGLIDKLSDSTRQVLEGAARLCVARTHYDVEVEHFLLSLIEQREGDFSLICKAFEVDTSKLSKELNASLDLLKFGSSRTYFYAPTLVEMFTHAWTIATLNFGADQIRTGFTILALRTEEDLRSLMAEASHEFEKIDAARLEKEFWQIVKGSNETSGSLSPAATSSTVAGGTPSKTTTPNLDQYTIDLTMYARSGKIDPVLGRDFEIRQVIDVLTRRRQNNPILVGEAGVGKTAIVEGLALKIASGDVPPPLRNVTLKTLDLALLQAGAGVKGEFENRLKGLIQEVKNSAIPIILFIDEAHTMIGAGGQAGQNDAANLLKPALARGELRTIAATTWSEYKRYFENDPALTRRFQLVKVDEPSEASCMLMMRSLMPALETHHGVRILDSGLRAAVTLSHRYLPDRQLPDKAVSVLDTACARVALASSTSPPALEESHRELSSLEVQERILRREQDLGADHSERLSEISAQRSEAQSKLDQLTLLWKQEADLAAEIHSLRQQIESDNVNGNKGALLDRLKAASASLESIQGDKGLLQVAVDSRTIEDVISGWTGIPVGKMLKDEIAVVMNLEEHLCARVIGQDHALRTISERIRTTRVNMDDPVKPVGVFLLVGPSGVGKTETALALSDLLYGGEDNVITINMSEFKEAHTVALLKGAPPGYKGYGEGGRLTEAIRRRPYSVLLLDEVEKAHPDVLEVFFQVFDKGRMEDGEGREIIFRNAIIILTSNAGTDTLMKLTADPETAPGPEGLVKALKPELNAIFKPAFLGRTVIVPYYPIRDENLKTIIRLKLSKIQRRLNEAHKITLTYDEALVNSVAARCTEVESGARNVDNILTNTLLPDISRQLLGLLGEGTRPDKLHVTADETDKLVYC